MLAIPISLIRTNLERSSPVSRQTRISSSSTHRGILTLIVVSVSSASLSMLGTLNLDSGIRRSYPNPLGYDSLDHTADEVEKQSCRNDQDEKRDVHKSPQPSSDTSRDAVSYRRALW